MEELTERIRAWAIKKGGRLPRPATAEEVAAAETRLGFPLHPLLKRLYLEVADGGFGPGDWTLMPVEELTPSPPDRVVAVMEIGCGMTSEVDCSDRDGRVLVMDPNSFDSHEPDAWLLDASTLEQWLEAWLDDSCWLCEQAGEDAEWPVPWEDAAERLAARRSADRG